MNANEIEIPLCPAGTYGLLVETWSKGDVYAVAADWTQAGSPIYVYRNLPGVQVGWRENVRHVGGSWDNPQDALRAVIGENVDASEEAVHGLVQQHAVEIEDPNATW